MAIPVSLIKEATGWRRKLHSQPELGYSEVKTSAWIAEQLRSFGLMVHTGLAETGVVGTLANGPGPTIGFRADMDALPVTERGQAEWRSTHPGVMHACGHDGHTAMLLAAAKHLSMTRNFNGTLHFVFQPAEENLGGARRMVEEGLFRLFPMDAIYALHNWPGRCIMPAMTLTMRSLLTAWRCGARWRSVYCPSRTRRNSRRWDVNAGGIAYPR